jgi:hypothetical protein
MEEWNDGIMEKWRIPASPHHADIPSFQYSK